MGRQDPKRSRLYNALTKKAPRKRYRKYFFI